jgi:hypothetical protein
MRQARSTQDQRSNRDEDKPSRLPVTPELDANERARLNAVTQRDREENSRHPLGIDLDDLLPEDDEAEVIALPHQGSSQFTARSRIDRAQTRLSQSSRDAEYVQVEDDAEIRETRPSRNRRYQKASTDTRLTIRETQRVDQPRQRDEIQTTARGHAASGPDRGCQVTRMFFSHITRDGVFLSRLTIVQWRS